MDNTLKQYTTDEIHDLNHFNSTIKETSSPFFGSLIFQSLLIYCICIYHNRIIGGIQILNTINEPLHIIYSVFRVLIYVIFLIMTIIVIIEALNNINKEIDILKVMAFVSFFDFLDERE